jgi:predicted ATPase
MLKTLHLKNFKAFANQQIALPALTVFTGVNGVGKSSFIQSLILLRQSHLNKDLPQRLILNHDKYVKLGKTQDIYHIYADSDKNEQISIAFDAEIDEKTTPIVFETEYEQNKLWLDIRRFSTKVDLLPRIALFNQNFQYLQADRISPQHHYEVNQYDVEVLNSLGSRGENTAYFLHLNSNKPINLPNLIDTETDNYLNQQLNFWLNKISKGARVRTQLQIGDTLAQLIYSFDDNNDRTPDFSPVNVGFGLTYVLPILVAVLTAKRGDMLIIENPESHLHPSGQSAIGRFLALAAQDGVQVIIETHSDHVINGIRVAAKQFEKAQEKGIKHDNVAIYYLNRSQERHVSNVHHIAIDAHGKLFKYNTDGTKTASLPKGFNDEFSNNLSKLI